MAERPRVRSGDAVFSFNEDMVVETWNEAAARLTGISEEEAVGAPCWLLLAATDMRGDLLCHAGCSNARLAREGWPVAPQLMLVRDEEGHERPLATSTVRIDQNGSPLFLHILREEGPPPEQAPPVVDDRPQLTARQQQILELMAAGRGARAIAAELRLAESTVRNHIRGVLVAFGAHSQLEAVAKARQTSFLRPA